MTNNSTVINDKHPKINKFLVYSGIISIITILVFFIAGMFSFGFLAFLIINCGYVILGLKEVFIGKNISAKAHDRLVGALLFVGAALMTYELIFNVLPNFKK